MRIFLAIFCSLASLSYAGLEQIYNVDQSPYSPDIARKVGDLVTVVIDENLETASTAGKATTKASGAKFDVAAKLPFGLSKLFDNPNFEYASDRNEGGTANDQGSQKVSTIIQARIIEQVSDNQFVIRAEKKVVLDGKERTIYLSGTIRARDITYAEGTDKVKNWIRSSQIAEAKLRIDGDLMTEDLSPGLLNQLVKLVF